eukprot:scaffold112649_cov72-Phaeocystis_antarctica.AAC.3
MQQYDGSAPVWHSTKVSEAGTGQNCVPLGEGLLFCGTSIRAVQECTASTLCHTRRALCVTTGASAHAAARDARAIGEVNVREGRAHRALRCYRPEAQRLMDACGEVRCRLGSGRVAQQLLAQAGGALLHVC